MITLNDIMLLLAVGILISTATLFPIIFNFFVIPKIEEKMRCKLEYTLVSYKMLPFGLFFGRWFEIALYISVKHFLSIFGVNPQKINFGPALALQKINYDFRKPCFFEIFISYFALISVIYFAVSGVFYEK